jgi:hypothetical protein
MTRSAGGIGALSLLLAAGCGSGTAPEEARFPVVEGLYNIETTLETSTCRGFTILDGSRIYVFFQDGGTIEFRPPTFDGQGKVELLDLGIRGPLKPDGEFEMSGTYTLTETMSGPGPIVGFSMSGRFVGDHVEGEEHHIPSFPGGSCEVTFRFEGDEV